MATGTIIDHHGNQSKQIDIIIYDEQITPPILLTSVEGIIPCHSVLATIEVKSILKCDKLREAVENARSVKSLKYDYDKIPASGEKGFEILYHQKILDQIPNDNIKDFIKRTLFTISSPACYIFSFSSDLTSPNESFKELERLKRVVKDLNEGGHIIRIPISGLCISDRSFTRCIAIEAESNEGVFDSEVATEFEFDRFKKSERYHASYNVVLRFLSDVINTCNVYSHQRSRIPLEVYFQLDNENDE
jgi:hypothetical protein